MIDHTWHSMGWGLDREPGCADVPMVGDVVVYNWVGSPVIGRVLRTRVRSAVVEAPAWVPEATAAFVRRPTPEELAVYQLAGAHTMFL